MSTKVIAIYVSLLYTSVGQAMPELQEIGDWGDPQRINQVILSKDCSTVLIVRRAERRKMELLANGKYLALADDIGPVSVSADGQHVAYAALINEQWRLSNGLLLTPYEISGQHANSLTIGEDGHIVYVGRKENAWYVMRDNKPGPASSEFPASLQFCRGRLGYIRQVGNTKEVVLDDMRSDSYVDIRDFQLSEDGQHYAYAAAIDSQRWITVVDGRIGPVYSQISRLRLSARNGGYTYIAQVATEPQQEAQYLVVFNGKLSGPFFLVNSGPLLSDDGSHYSFEATELDQDVAPDGHHFSTKVGYIDGKRIKPWNYWVQESAFSPNNSRFAIVDLKLDLGGGTRGYHPMHYELLIGETESSRWASPNGGRAFSEDSRRSPIWGSSMSGLTFSADNTRVACAIRGAGMKKPSNNDRWAIYVDGKLGPLYDKVAPVLFSANSKRVAYAARRDDHWRMIIDGQELPYELVRSSEQGEPLGQWRIVEDRERRTINSPGDDELGARLHKEQLPYYFDQQDRLNFIGVRMNTLNKIKD